MNPVVDRFGRIHTYLRIAVTDRCNLRCTYCMPLEGVPWREREEILSYEEIYRAARLLVALGIRKIRLTGGEPTVRTGIEELVARLAGLPGLETLAMTTNGVLLKDKARALKASGLAALNISLDTLKQERFMHIARRDSFYDVMTGIDAALAAGFVPLKLNTVVIGGVNDDEMLEFVEFVQDKPINIRFIEYMPFSGNQWDRNRFVPYHTMMETIQARYPLIPMNGGAISHTPSDNKTDPPSRWADMAKDFRIEGSLGTVSFITPISAEFCQTCSRLRLTADGALKTCLFYPAEVNIRDALRSGVTDAALAEIIRSAVMLKPPNHPSVEQLEGLDRRSMAQIGG